MDSQLKVPIRVMRIIARMNVGGPAIQVTTLSKGLDKEIFHQELITGFCEEGEADYLETNQIDLSEIRVNGLGRSLKPLDDLRALFKIRSLIKTFRPHIIHTHTAKAGVLGRFASLWFDPKIIRIHTFHGHLLYGYFAKWKTSFVIFLEKLLAYKTDILIAVGEKVRDELLSAGIGKISQYSIFPPGFTVKSPQGILTRGDLNIPKDSFCCAWIGRLVDIKKPDRILEIVRTTNRISMNIHFLVIGGGPHLERLKELSDLESLPITFLGWRNDIEELIYVCDVMLLTSENEGTPISLIQAQRLGKPVISTDVGSVKEVMINGKTGFAVSYDAQLFAERILDLKENPDTYRSFSNAAKDFSNERFSESRLIRDHEKLYRELIVNQSNS